MNQPRRQSRDRRVQKTEKVLAEALDSLIREKSFDTIAVREILDRANVGRSTFYTHYRDKEELLVSHIREMLESARPSVHGRWPERVLWFSLPIFEHLERHRSAGESRMGPRGRAILHQRLRTVLVDLLSDQLSQEVNGVRRRFGKVPPDLLVQHVTSTFILVLNWWVESGSRLTADQVNDMFRAMILPALPAG
jgi:AcrR family transcriptional regulator